jgi:anti-sigma B factor antagonist
MVAEPAQETTSTLATGHEAGRYFVIALRGEWDLYNRPQLEAALLEAEAAAESLVVLDLTHATFIDSSVLGALVEARKRMQERVRIAVVAEDRRIRKVFQITGLDGVFALHESMADLTRQSI